MMRQKDYHQATYYYDERKILIPTIEDSIKSVTISGYGVRELLGKKHSGELQQFTDHDQLVNLHS